MKTKNNIAQHLFKKIVRSPLSYKMSLLLFLVLPIIASESLHEDESLRSIFQYSMIFFGCVSAVLLVQSSRWTHFLRWPLLGAVSLYYLGLYGLIGYQLIVNHTFDPTFFEFGIDLHSMVDLMGLTKTILFCTGSVVGFISLYVTLHAQSKFLQQSLHVSVRSIGAMALVLCMSALQVDNVYGQHITKPQLERDKIIITPDNSHYIADSDENVIILQLESTNALAMAGYLDYEGKKYDGFYMPHMEYVARDGTFFPLFFSNQQQTIRAQEAIICGIPGNTGERLSGRMDEAPTDCLPKRLHESGYDTVFLPGFKGMSFMDLDKFMEGAGFSDFVREGVMEEGDRDYGWGYDDCTFYKRAFDYLNEEHSEKKKKFVYMEVSSNHANFHPKEEYEFTHLLDGSENYLANYINATLEQDYCLSKFYEEYKGYAPDNTHLFIVGDHPWGLQEGWARYAGHAENFLVPMAYVPPRSRKDEFKTMNVVEDYFYSQSDMTPTIMSLLNNKSYQNSFSFELKKPTTVAGFISHMSPVSYEQCHVLHELYDGGVTAIVQGMKKYTYVHAESTVYYADLSTDLLEKDRIVLEEDADFSEFIQKYTCDRFTIETNTEQM